MDSRNQSFEIRRPQFHQQGKTRSMMQVPSPRKAVQQKLFNFLNQKVVSPFRTQTNRAITVVQDTQINDTETNRRKVSRPKLSLNYQSLVNQKIDDLFQQSRSSQQDWMRNRIESSMEEESVKKQLVFIQKINALEKEKNELKLLVKQKDDIIAQQTNSIQSLDQQLEMVQGKIQQYVNIEKQVNELEKYCNQILAENQALKNKLNNQGDLVTQQIMKDCYGKGKTLEKNLTQLADKISKCNKITVMLFNKEDLPLELFVQHLRKKQVPEETGFDSNLLSPMDSKWTQIVQIEMQQKIVDLLSYSIYISSQLLTKADKILGAISSRYITSMSDTFNQNFF